MCKITAPAAPLSIANSVFSAIKFRLVLLMFTMSLCFSAVYYPSRLPYETHTEAVPSLISTKPP